jgi:hypothetical protein
VESSYTDKHKAEMITLYQSLSEKDRRRYAAVEASKLGHGGIRFIASLFECDAKTVQRGMRDLQSPEALCQEEIRKEGGGRKALVESMEKINEAFIDTLKDHTAGDPMDDKVKWTSLSCKGIATALKKRV